MRALIMAGGEGRRLHPLTRQLPKPLLKVGSKPILEHVLLQLKRFGVDSVTLAVSHLASTIESYFGSGGGVGIRLSYLHETTPLGTAGALSRIEGFDGPFFMMNGDLLTDLDFLSLLAKHRSQRARLTIASKVMYTNLSLGVIDGDATGRVSAYREKPRLKHRVGLGIYVVDPAIRASVPSNQRLDMPDLINTLISAGQTVAFYEHPGNWVDIGTPDEYARLEEHDWLAPIVGFRETAEETVAAGSGS